MRPRLTRRPPRFSFFRYLLLLRIDIAASCLEKVSKVAHHLDEFAGCLDLAMQIHVLGTLLHEVQQLFLPSELQQATSVSLCDSPIVHDAATQQRNAVGTTVQSPCRARLTPS